MLTSTVFITNNSNTHVEMVWWHYKVSLDIVLLQIMVSLLSVAVLNFVVTVEIDQGLLSNVYPSAFDYKLFFSYPNHSSKTSLTFK